jgi:Fe-Mn family superoxide dismutase
MDRRTLLGTLAAGSAGLALNAKGLGQTPAAAAQAPAASPSAEFVARAFDFGTGLNGLSKELLAEHLTLYKGYVTRCNALLKEVQGDERAGKNTSEDMELRRRLGFEFSGMRLHELYFEALSNTAAAPSATHPLQKAIVATWGSFDAWWAAFKGTCTMPGIGWGALVKDPVTGRLMNAWFQDHENAIPVGTTPLLIVDVWEHAYVKDYNATGRGKYVDAVKPLIDWRIVEKRF